MQFACKTVNVSLWIRIKTQWFSSSLHFSTQESCKVGSKGIERQVLLFDKLLLILKKKDEKTYTYKGHIVVCSLHVQCMSVLQGTYKSMLTACTMHVHTTRDI